MARQTLTPQLTTNSQQAMQQRLAHLEEDNRRRDLALQRLAHLEEDNRRRDLALQQQAGEGITSDVGIKLPVNPAFQTFLADKDFNLQSYYGQGNNPLAGLLTVARQGTAPVSKAVAQRSVPKGTDPLTVREAGQAAGQFANRAISKLGELFTPTARPDARAFLDERYKATGAYTPDPKAATAIGESRESTLNWIKDSWNAFNASYETDPRGSPLGNLLESTAIPEAASGISSAVGTFVDTLGGAIKRAGIAIGGQTSGEPRKSPEPITSTPTPQEKPAPETTSQSKADAVAKGVQAEARARSEGVTPSLETLEDVGTEAAITQIEQQRGGPVSDEEKKGIRAQMRDFLGNLKKQDRIDLLSSGLGILAGAADRSKPTGAVIAEGLLGGMQVATNERRAKFAQRMAQARTDIAAQNAITNRMNALSLGQARAANAAKMPNSQVKSYAKSYIDTLVRDGAMDSEMVSTITPYMEEAVRMAHGQTTDPAKRRVVATAIATQMAKDAGSLQLDANWFSPGGDIEAVDQGNFMELIFGLHGQ